MAFSTGFRGHAAPVYVGLLVASCVWVAGCSPELPESRYGEVLRQVPHIEGSDGPYVMPRLAPKMAPADPEASSTSPTQDTAEPAAAAAAPDEVPSVPANPSTSPGTESTPE